MQLATSCRLNPHTDNTGGTPSQGGTPPTPRIAQTRPAPGAVEDEMMAEYDAWKTREPDYWSDEDEDGCTCPRRLNADGARKTDRWCPLHGTNPDAKHDEGR
jgi:hypothetical protein